jgi:hypothetical protein
MSAGGGHASEVRRGVEDPLPVRKEVAARRPAPARRQEARRLLRRVGVHLEDLVAGARRTGRLEDELLPVGGPVGLRVFAAERELPEVGEVPLAVVRERGEGSFEGVRRRSLRRERDEPGEERGGGGESGDVSHGFPLNISER